MRRRSPVLLPPGEMGDGKAASHRRRRNGAPRTALSIQAQAFLRHGPAGPQQVGTAAPGGRVRDDRRRRAETRLSDWPARSAGAGCDPRLREAALGGRVEPDPDRSGGARLVRCKGDEKEPVGHAPRLVGGACVRGSGRCHSPQGIRHAPPASGRQLAGLAAAWPRWPCPVRPECRCAPRFPSAAIRPG